MALKVLLPAVATDGERIARFEHEARVLAALNHPNIAAIHGVVRDASRIALVMELLDGATLAARIAAGPLAVADASAIVRQLAVALDAAHDKGIVHRDLKPSNVIVSPAGLVKVLDFGLAKMVESASGTGDTAGLDGPSTGTGTVMGTAAYMSPEQANGLRVDKRTDIWALGCVWFELLTGDRAFRGNSSAETLAAVLREDPDWSRLPANFPPRLRTVLVRCLAKAWHERLADVSTVGFVLEEPDSDRVTTSDSIRHVTTTSESKPRLRPRAIAGLALGASALVGFGAWSWSLATRLGSPAEPAPMVRSSILLPAGFERAVSVPLAVSPDGALVVFRAIVDGRPRLYKRRMSDAQITPIDGAEFGSMPFFSPDGQWLGFVARGQIKKVRVEGGQPQLVGDLASVAGASWGDDDVIVAGRRESSGLWRVPASGGPPVRLTTVTAEDANNDHRWPQVLPGGRGVLFSVGTGPEESARIVVLDARTGARKDLLRGSASARYVPTGHLVYARHGELLAVPFDLDRLEITGASLRIAEGVNEDTDGAPEYAFSNRGDLVYGAGWSGGDRNVLTLVGLDGTARETAFPRGPLADPRFSFDGRRVAVTVAAAKNNVWVYDLDRASATQVTAGRYHAPIWTRDGRLLISRGPPAQHDLVLRNADLEGPEELLAAWDREQYRRRLDRRRTSRIRTGAGRQRL